jgi:selenocysteine lyase/cysteine desulfurase
MAVRGADDFTRLVDYDFTLRDDARRFEVLTLDYAAIVGMIASLELLHELGPDAVAAHVRGLVDRVVAWAESRDDVRLVTPADPARRAGIVAVAPHDPAAASARLKAAGVIHSLREGAVRLAPHGYNTDDEIDRALAALAE